MGSPPTARPEPHLRVHGITVFVRDQERSKRFYLDQLGFRLVYDVQVRSGERYVAVIPPDGTAMLSLIAPKPNTPEHKLIGRSTQVVLVTDDVTAKFREWSKRGVRFQRTPRLRRVKFEPPMPEVGGAPAAVPLGRQMPIWGSVVARFRDIDGNIFTLMSFDLITQGLEEQRRVEAEKQEAERRAAQELEIARQVQARLFPQSPPSSRTLDCQGLCIPARHVGGDYYDFLDLGRGRYGLVIGDIVGKGIAAALLMANLQAYVRSQCATVFDHPQRLLQAVNLLFAGNAPDGSFATLFFAEYDDEAGVLRYANCGHPAALLLHANGDCERLCSTATVLGVFKEWSCAVEERRLMPGDLLALYTDGVTESFNEAGEEFGEHRLIEALRRHRDLPQRDLLAAITGEVREFSPHEQHDDITLIVAKSRPAGGLWTV